jgi:tetratricopeptide (TPR) repeat protein
MLSSFGVNHIDLAGSSDEAMEKCRFNFYDIILCDFNLGHGKNGQQILEALKLSKRVKHTQLFIMITAETAKDVVLGAREFQPDAYIAKPITRSVLEKRLSNLIKQQQLLKPINREIELENYAKAISLCHQKIDQKDKYQSWCYQTLGSLYLKVGDAVNAKKVYQTILNNRELPWALLGLGQAMLINQEYQSAISIFENTLKLNSNLLEAYDGLAECYIKLNHTKRAQDILQEAVSLSPRLIPRQEKLGSLSRHNQDIATATQAYRTAIRFGEHSIHDKPEIYLNLGRCLAEWSEDDLSPEGKGRAAEAIDVLEKTIHKFTMNEDACVNATLIEARVYSGQRQASEAENKLHYAESTLEEDAISAEVGLELAKTLFTLKQSARAEALLIRLAKKFADDAAVIAQIESLLDEPESLLARKQAKDLNRKGIALFEQGQLDAAADAIETALSFTPRHAALNLNLIQVLLKKYESTADKNILIKAKTCLKTIQHIPEQHNQFKRMMHVAKTINNLLDSATAGTK